MAFGPRALIGGAAVATAALLATLASRQAEHHIVQAGFWFDAVTYQAPALTADYGGPLAPAERDTIERLAHDELTRAFAPWRIDITTARAAHYGVRVVQAFPPRRGVGAMAVAESRAFGPLGGVGMVSFETLAALAAGYAPPGTSRVEFVAAIGRGLGRVAAHELAHQIVPHRNFHLSTDEASYDFAAANRTRQFYGDLHWDVAGPWLASALGRRATATAPP